MGYVGLSALGIEFLNSHSFLHSLHFREPFFSEFPEIKMGERKDSKTAISSVPVPPCPVDGPGTDNFSNKGMYASILAVPLLACLLLNVSMMWYYPLLLVILGLPTCMCLLPLSFPSLDVSHRFPSLQPLMKTNTNTHIQSLRTTC
jgi:hypothetical protein